LCSLWSWNRRCLQRRQKAESIIGQEAREGKIEEGEGGWSRRRLMDCMPKESRDIIRGCRNCGGLFYTERIKKCHVRCLYSSPMTLRRNLVRCSLTHMHVLGMPRTGPLLVCCVVVWESQGKKWLLRPTKDLTVAERGTKKPER
jgi:hypothetical protein